MAEEKKSGHDTAGVGAWPQLDLAAPLQQFARLSVASAGMWSAWAKTWETIVRERGSAALTAALGSGSGESVSRGFDPGTLAENLEQVFGLPHLADMMNVDMQAFRLLEPSLELLRIKQDYLLVAGELSVETCQRFQRRLEEARAQGQQFEGVGEVLDTWNAVVDETLIEFNRSTSFSELQKRFLRATMRHRLEQRNLTEKVCELYDMPTRSEVDELHRKMHDLRREVRRLRRGQSEAAPQTSVSNETSASRETPASPETAEAKGGSERGRKASARSGAARE